MAFIPINFINQVGPAIPASWLNQIDYLSNSVFQSAQTNPNARTALFSDGPLELVNGGTGRELSS